MRRRDREITDREKMLEIVAECDCCRLGLVDNGEAYIVPMNFGFEDAGSALTLYFHCAAEGRKLDLIGSGADVSFEMDCSHALRAADIACAFRIRTAASWGAATPLLSRTEMRSSMRWG